MYLLGLDFETTGLDPANDLIIEVGAVVWDTETHTPVELYSRLINIGDRALLPEIIELTGITDAHLRDFGIPVELALDEIFAMAKKCDFVVAHNGLVFDRPFLNAACTRAGKTLLNHPWIDTMVDVEYPTQLKTRKLTYLALEHNYLAMNAHRAVFDVMAMFQILKCYDIPQIAERAGSALVTVVAQVSYDNRTQASERGFRWDPSQKTWSKLMREYDVNRAEFPFSVSRIEFSY